MVGSGRIASECSPGERFSLCRHWSDPADDFADVVVRGRRGPRVSVEMLSGPETGAMANVFASSLWTPDQLAYARERRERDLRIAELDREQPVDDVSELAIQILCLLATGDTVIEDETTLEVLLSQLGRPVRLDELYEFAYADGGEISAPAEAWRGLFEEFARSIPNLIEERVSEIASGWSGIGDAERGLVVARIRQWAGLPPIATPLEVRPPREKDAGKRIAQAIAKAASRLREAPQANGESLAEGHRAYLDARKDLADATLSVSKEIDARRRIAAFAEGLRDSSGRAVEPLMAWLLDQVGVRGALCDHIVWSDYSPQHPRTLHLFPDGHLFPEEEGISRRSPGAVTACGKQVAFRRASTNTWERAWRGEWLQHYEALARYRSELEREKAEGGRPRNHLFEPDYEMARRICPRCAEFHGLFLECLESGSDDARWAPWRLVEISDRVGEALGNQLREEQEIGSLGRARQVALEHWLREEIESTAREIKRRGPGPLRRLFGERFSRSPSLYDQWATACDRAGLEPHELLSESLWIEMLTESLDIFEQGDAQRSARRDVEDRIRSVVEARIAGLHQ